MGYHTSNPFGDAVPEVASIAVSGTTVFGAGTNHAESLRDFKRWLVNSHPSAKVVVRCRWRPEEYGRAKVKITPVEPVAAGSLGRRALSAEESFIETIWRESVGWGDE